MLYNKKAVIFDLDGTIVDSMWVWTEVDIVFLGERGLTLPDDLQEYIEGMSFSETAEYFKQRFNLKEDVEELKNIWNQMAYDMYANKVKLKPGVFKFIEFLKERGFKLGIATSNSRELVEATLRNNKIIDCFDCILTACEVNAGKPDPDIYLEVAKRINVKPADCLVFEDVPMGILAGINAGMEVCAVYDIFSESSDKEKKRLANYYIKSYEDCFDKSYEILHK